MIIYDGYLAGAPRLQVGKTFGVHSTLELLERHYYWPWMRDNVEAYVKTCLVCQQDKVEQQKVAGSLEPLPIPSRPWESISMNFIVSLPKSEGCALNRGSSG